MSSNSSETFEMFWDCPHCGTKKLLGITHRHCPNCGAAQDENYRYFPADGEEVALHNHIYYGMDWDCQFCSTPNSKNSNNCVNCGGLKLGSYEVNLVGNDNKIIKTPISKKIKIGENNTSSSNKLSKNQNETYHSIIENQEQQSNKFSIFLIFILSLFFLFLIGFFIYGFNHITPKDTQLTTKNWSRSIDIEQYSSFNDDSWCSSIPYDAYNVTKRKEIKSYTKVVTGEVCSTHKKDNGDGSFSKYRTCEDTYKNIPVYENKCYYKINKWKFSHKVYSNGNDDEPEWPSLTNENLNNSNILGNKREGSHSENYSVIFTYYDDNKKKDKQCFYSQDTWRVYIKNKKYTLNIRMIGGIDCSTIH